MSHPIHRELAAVRHRQQQVVVRRAVACGLVISGGLGLILAMIRWLTGGDLSPLVILAVLVSGPLVALVIGLLRKQTWQTAAQAVDEYYLLKDRAVTALSFAGQPTPTPLQSLQVSDALIHLRGIDAAEVVPLRTPRLFPYGVALLAVAVVLSCLPVPQAPLSAAVAEPLPGIVAEAEVVAEQLDKLRELAKETDNPELDKLIEQLAVKVEEMKQPGVDVREALARLSEMQASIQTQQAQYHVEQVDAELRAVGDALSITDSLKSAGQALSAGQYEKGAEELEQHDAPKLERKEAKALAEKLQKASESMRDKGMGALSRATSSICESCKNGGDGLNQGLKRLAGECRSQARRKKINELLINTRLCLSECKCNCQKNSLAKGLRPKKSTSPSTNFGMTTSGNLFGDKTDLNSRRNMEQITGQAGEGPSEVETTHEVERRQHAGREYRSVYQKYRRMSESVLDSEPIPLGHRQTIRRYFELIRPDNNEAELAPESSVGPATEAR